MPAIETQTDTKTDNTKISIGAGSFWIEPLNGQNWLPWKWKILVILWDLNLEDIVTWQVLGYVTGKLPERLPLEGIEPWEQGWEGFTCVKVLVRRLIPLPQPLLLGVNACSPP